jgi:GTP cyclohydrolase FolE2
MIWFMPSWMKAGTPPFPETRERRAASARLRHAAPAARGQRSCISIRAEIRGDVSMEELIRIAEQSASCELYGLLKRPDEKYVTERAYDNPRFVEDIVREVALRLQRDARIGRFEVEAENFESIHTILRLHGSPI